MVKASGTIENTKQSEGTRTQPQSSLDIYNKPTRSKNTLDTLENINGMSIGHHFKPKIFSKMDKRVPVFD